MNREAFYTFLQDWLGRLLRDRASTGRPRMVGLSAPQGAGKTTLTRELCRLTAADGFRTVALSIDDFYITRTEQIDLAKRHSDNPYLQHRVTRGRTTSISVRESWPP